MKLLEIFKRKKKATDQKLTVKQKPQYIIKFRVCIPLMKGHKVATALLDIVVDGGSKNEAVSNYKQHIDEIREIQIIRAVPYQPKKSN